VEAVEFEVLFTRTRHVREFVPEGLELPHVQGVRLEGAQRGLLYLDYLWIIAETEVVRDINLSTNFLFQHIDRLPLHTTRTTSAVG
jgi:hypothetical protein